MIPSNDEEAMTTNPVKESTEAIKMTESTEKETDLHERQPYPTPDSDAEEDVIPGQHDETPAEVTSEETGEATAIVPTREIGADLNPANIVEGPRTRKPSSRAQAFTVQSIEPGVNMAFAILRTTKNRRYHRDDLPPEPEYWQEMIQMPYPHAEGFKAAANKEFEEPGTRDTFQGD